MNNQEVNEYMDAVLTGKIKLEGLEAKVVSKLSEMSEEIGKLEKFVGQVSNQLEQAKIRLVNLNGRREGYAQLLVDEEVHRRQSVKEALSPIRAKVVPQERPLGDVLDTLPSLKSEAKIGR